MSSSFCCALPRCILPTLIAAALALSACRSTSYVRATDYSPTPRAKPEVTRQGRTQALILKDAQGRATRVDALSQVRFEDQRGRLSPWYDPQHLSPFTTPQGRAAVLAHRPLGIEDVDAVLISSPAAQGLDALRAAAIEGVTMRALTPALSPDQDAAQAAQATAVVADQAAADAASASMWLVELGPHARRWQEDVRLALARVQHQERAICAWGMDLGEERQPPYSCDAVLRRDDSLCWRVATLTPQRAASLRLRQAQQVAAWARPGQEAAAAASGAQTQAIPAAQAALQAQWLCQGQLRDEPLGRWTPMSTRHGLRGQAKNASALGGFVDARSGYAIYILDELRGVEVHNANGLAYAPWLLLTAGLAGFTMPYIILSEPGQPALTQSSDALTLLKQPDYEQALATLREPSVTSNDNVWTIFDLRLEAGLGVDLDGQLHQGAHLSFVLWQSLELGFGLHQRPERDWAGLFRLGAYADLDAPRRWALTSGMELGSAHWRLHWGLRYNPWADLMLTLRPMSLVTEGIGRLGQRAWVSSLDIGWQL